MASIKKINERKFKITISNGYRADGRKISKAKTITVPDTVPRKQIEQYVNHAAVELERVFKIGYAEYGEMSFEEYSRHWLARQLKYSQGTRESYRRILEKVYPYIGDIEIAKLRPLALENMLAELRKMQHHGKPIKESTVQKYLTVVSAVLSDVKRNLNVHSLRHTNASLLIANGTDVAMVSSLLGHAQVSTTLDIYTHAFDKNKKAASDKLHNALEI